MGRPFPIVGRAWRDKEFVAVFTDGRHRDEGIKAWLNSYHSTEPFVSCLDHVNSTTKSTASPTLSCLVASALTLRRWPPSLSTPVADKLSQWTQFGFQRAGTIIAAVNLDIRTTRPSELTLLAGMSVAPPSPQHCIARGRLTRTPCRPHPQREPTASCLIWISSTRPSATRAAPLARSTCPACVHSLSLSLATHQNFLPRLPRWTGA